MTFSSHDLNSLSRRELQKRCKEVGIKANSKTVVLISRLQKFYTSQKSSLGNEENAPSNDKSEERVSLNTDVDMPKSILNNVYNENEKYSSLSRSELQAIAKENGIRANQKTKTIIENLEALSLQASKVSQMNPVHTRKQNDVSHFDENSVENLQSENVIKVKNDHSVTMVTSEQQNQEVIVPKITSEQQNQEVIVPKITPEQQIQEVIAPKITSEQQNQEVIAPKKYTSEQNQEVVPQKQNIKISIKSDKPLKSSIVSEVKRLSYDKHGRRKDLQKKRVKKAKDWDRIHRQEFKKMENLLQHEERRTQEAKNLLRVSHHVSKNALIKHKKKIPPKKRTLNKAFVSSHKSSHTKAHTQYNKTKPIKLRHKDASFHVSKQCSNIKKNHHRRQQMHSNQRHLTHSEKVKSVMSRTLSKKKKIYSETGAHKKKFDLNASLAKGISWKLKRGKYNPQIHSKKMNNQIPRHKYIASDKAKLNSIRNNIPLRPFYH